MSAPLVKISHGTFTVTLASPAIFTRIAHGLVLDNIVYFTTTGALPTGLVVGTAYYVISAGLTADVFEVSATKGGSAINTSISQSGVHTLVVDRTTSITSDGLIVSRALTSQIDMCNFEVIVDSVTDWKPSMLDDVKVLEDSTVIFAGTLIESDETLSGGNVQIISCLAKDYSFDLDRELVANVYENTNVQLAIEDIITNYSTGFTFNNVAAVGAIDYLAFKYEYPSKCLQQLAELSGCDWYVDEDKDIHFFAKESIASPFNLTDTNGKYYFDSLKIKNDVKNLRNTIIVRGGTYLGSTLTETQIADGNQITFLLAYKYSNTSWTVAGSAITVGIDFIDDPTLFDAVYNFNEKALKFPSGSQPTNGQVVSVTGDPHIPVIVRVKDPVAIAAHGAFEYKVVDTSINSKEGARDRASAELRGWSTEIHEGKFQTKEAGLKVGMAINVQSTIRGIDQDYIVNRITSTLRPNGNEWRHEVSLVTTQTFGMMEFLQYLLIQKDKEIKIDQNEVVDLVESYFETIVLSETIMTSLVHNPQTETVAIAEVPTVQALDYAVIFCVGEITPYPDGFKRQFILNGSPLG